jgi:hypothetical protein
VFLKLRTEYPLVAVDVMVDVVDVFDTSNSVDGELVPIPTLPPFAIKTLELAPVPAQFARSLVIVILLPCVL